MKRRRFRLAMLTLSLPLGLAEPHAAGSRVRGESAADDVALASSVRGRRAHLRTGGADTAELSSRATPAIRRISRSAVRGEILRRQSGTYIDELLLARDSALVRWPVRLEKPLVVWVQPEAHVSDFDTRFPRQVRAAFLAWSGTGIPVEFAFTGDSSRADVRVTWVERFQEPVSGKTLWARDGRWWMVDANILLATHHSTGDPLDPSAIHALALHEVGHLLGLDHTVDPSNIMTPRVRVRELSASDIATVRLLYDLPPGPVR